jgi:prepilin peptidase CpaA
LSLGFFILASALLIYAALHDLAARTVPNWLSVALLLIGVCARVADHSLLAGLAAAAIAFVLLFGVWIGGAMGGGDVKLWAATVLVVPPFWQSQLAFFLDVVVLGGVLALIYLALSFLVPRVRASSAGGLFKRAVRAELWRIRRRASLPYACAIAGGAFAILLPHAFQP